MAAFPDSCHTNQYDESVVEVSKVNTCLAEVFKAKADGSGAEEIPPATRLSNSFYYFNGLGHFNKFFW